IRSPRAAYGSSNANLPPRSKSWTAEIERSTRAQEGHNRRTTYRKHKRTNRAVNVEVNDHAGRPSTRTQSKSWPPNLVSSLVGIMWGKWAPTGCRSSQRIALRLAHHVLR